MLWYSRRSLTRGCAGGILIKSQTSVYRSPITQHPKGISMARTVNCIKLGREAEGMDFPPYPGDLGKRIWESVSKEAWGAWLKQQTMLVNENRLNLADQRAREYLKRQMENHFFGSGADVAQGYVPPANT